MTFVKKQPATTPAGVEQVIGAASADLKRGLDSLQASINTINGLGATADDLALKINNRNADLVALDQLYAEKERQLTVAVQLNIKEKGVAACTDMLNQVGKVAIDAAELSTLKTNYGNLQNSFKDDLQKGIGAATGVMKTQHENDIKLLQAQQKQEQAENTAKIGSQADQIALLKSQVDMLTKQLDAERAAGVQRAQANVAPVVNVGNQR